MNWYYAFAITLLSLPWTTEVNAAPKACSADTAAVLVKVRQYSEVKKYHSAIRCLNQAISLKPEDRDLAFARIRVRAWSGDHQGARAEFERVGGQDAESAALNADLLRFADSVPVRSGSAAKSNVIGDRDVLNELSASAAETWDNLGGVGREVRFGYSRWMGVFKLRLSAMSQSAARFSNHREYTHGVGVGYAGDNFFSEIYYESGFKAVTFNRAGLALYHEQNLSQQLYLFGNIKKSWYANDSVENYAMGGGWYGTFLYSKLSIYTPLNGTGRYSGVLDNLLLWSAWEAGIRLTTGQIPNPKLGNLEESDIKLVGGGVLANVNVTANLRFEALYQERFAKGYRDSRGEVGVAWDF